MGKNYLKTHTLATFDCETDPFKFGEKVSPFICELYVENQHYIFEGDDCIEQFYDFLQNQNKRKFLIYAHNGGKFDYRFLFFKNMLDGKLKILNGGRIGEAQIKETEHIIRDSYLLFPEKLEQFKKDKFDYDKMLKENRSQHMTEIKSYLKNDCKYLFDLMRGFLDKAGNKLTIGSAAIASLKKFTPYESSYQSLDTMLRPWYFGGRVQYFKRGIFEGDFKVYDVNSMYPSVMKKYRFGNFAAGYYKITPKLNYDWLMENPCLLHINALNKGALCSRKKGGGLTFLEKEGDFYTTSYELAVALKYNLVLVNKVHVCYKAIENLNFSNFVDFWYSQRQEAKLSGDKILNLYSKYMLNSAYGKFGQNPDKYYDYRICHFDDELLEGEEIETEIDGEFEVRRKKAIMLHYYDVAIASFITGAARSVLLEAIQLAEDPYYCDTDSLICSGFPQHLLDDTELGKWKLEAEGKSLAIYRKKFYCLKENKYSRKALKSASKGVYATPKQIYDLCRGKNITFRKDAPSIKLSGEWMFTERTLKGIM